MSVDDGENDGENHAYPGRDKAIKLFTCKMRYELVHMVLVQPD